jgi:hypothetical protein
MFKRLLREPLAHFLAIGLLLFLVFRMVGGDRSAGGREIVVSEQVVGTLVQQFSGVWQRQPTPKELQGLVDNWVREEVLFREGLHMGLDRDDPVIRRRVRQKVDVLAEESQPSQATTDAELSQWLRENPARYALAPVLSFEQAMIDPTRHASDLKKVTDDMQRQLQRGVDPAEATESHLKSQGVSNWKDVQGIYTFTLKDGHWSFDYVAYGGGEDHQAGIYRVEGDDIYWLWDPCCSHPNPVLHWKWSVDGSGTLHFTQVSGPPDWALALPFPRIGDVQ